LIAIFIAFLASCGATPRSNLCDESVCRLYLRALPAIFSGTKNALSKNILVVLSVIEIVI